MKSVLGMTLNRIKSLASFSNAVQKILYLQFAKLSSAAECNGVHLTGDPPSLRLLTTSKQVQSFKTPFIHFVIYGNAAFSNYQTLNARPNSAETPNLIRLNVAEINAHNKNRASFRSPCPDPLPNKSRIIDLEKVGARLKSIPAVVQKLREMRPTCILSLLL